MAEPWILDLFCKAGGAGMGYARAGFRVRGVDIEPQPHYPFEFVQADAMTYPLEGYDAIHASPPCQRYSEATPPDRRDEYPDLLPGVRARLEASGVPWIIENVPRAPMRPDFKICGCIFPELPELERERWFETSWQGFELRAPCWHELEVITVTGHGPRGSSGKRISVKDWRRAMGIDWMTRDELSQAIPPAYTQYLGGFLLEQVRARV